jgi:hypothetical protein
MAILRAREPMQNGSGALAGAVGSPATVVGSTGCLGRVAEWQTRWLQVPVSFGTWGFKSPFAHEFPIGSLGSVCAR